MSIHHYKAALNYILLFALLSGCVSRETGEEKGLIKDNETSQLTPPPTMTVEFNKSVMQVSPVIDLVPLGGYYEMTGPMFMALNGSISEVKERLNDIVVRKAEVQSVFSSPDDLNFVVFRGVFPSGGYSIDIENVERQGDVFTVHATYTDPGKGIFVAGVITHPTAIIPIGKLPEGRYEARLNVTSRLVEGKGERSLEEDKEFARFAFSVR